MVSLKSKIVTIGALCFFSFPALIIYHITAPNENLSSLRSWSLTTIFLINAFITTTHMLIKNIEINIKILKAFAILLTSTIGAMTYALSSVMSSLFLEKELDRIFVYQTALTLAMGLALGVPLFFVQLHLKKLNADEISVPTFFALSALFMLYKTEMLDLDEGVELWVRISILMTALFSLS